jgi:tellurite resistance protein TerC
MEIGLNIWIGLSAVLLGLLLLDFFTTRKPHEVEFKEAAGWSIFYIAVAVLFGVWVWVTHGSQYGTEYFAAYLVEKSLSVDNLFVFAIILAQFAVPNVLHQRVLLFGVVLALFMRGIFIAVGAAALHAFAFTFVIFGAILIWTGIKLFQHWDEDPDPSENKSVALVRKFIPVTTDFHGEKAFIKIDGKRFATPLLLVMVAVASTDLLFALDSIPATFGVTQEPFLVFTANAFALLGLRALYFLLQSLLSKIVYLSIGLSAILVFIGVKLIMTYAHEAPWLIEQGILVPKIPIIVSLGVIAAILVIATVASVIKVRKDPSATAHAGRLTDAEEPEAN